MEHVKSASKHAAPKPTAKPQAKPTPPAKPEVQQPVEVDPPSGETRESEIEA